VLQPNPAATNRTNLIFGSLWGLTVKGTVALLYYCVARNFHAINSWVRSCFQIADTST